MQFKLLNFHKMLANFAVNIIGVFVPLIVYSYTGSITFALIYLLCQYTVRFVATTLLRTQIEKRPQLFLLLRIAPILIYASMLLVIDTHLWVAVVGLCVFGGLSDSFNSFSNEVILNYSSLNRGGKSFGLTRMFEQLGVILSVILGGFFLDNLDKSVVVFISISIYLVSVVPLLAYYIKFYKDPNFNKEAISNAYLTYGQKSDRTKRGQTTSKKILVHYFVLYLLMCFIDSLVTLFNLHMFITYGQFTFASFVSASFNGAFGLSSFIVGKLNEKYDTTLAATIGAAIMAVLVPTLMFVKSPVTIIAIFTIIGGLYPLSSIFLIERMLIKTRILGISNQALFNRDRANIVGKAGGYAMGVFGMFVPVFFAIGALFMAYALLIPYTEEKTRKLLVKYLENS